MICPNCGAELKEDAEICKSCGWEPAMTNETYMEEELDTTVTSDLAENPVQYENETRTNTYDLLYTANRSSLKKHIKQLDFSWLLSGKRKWIIVAVLVISLIAAISITSSDSYKIDKATSYLLKGNTSAALKKISKIYTQQAEVMRSYAALEDAKSAFEAYCDTKGSRNAYGYFGVSDASNSTDNDAVIGFIDAMEVFDDNNKTSIYLLPSKLRERVQYYQKVCESITDAERQSHALFSDMMGAIRNKFERNEVAFSGVYYTVGSRYFTLNQLSERAEKARVACEKFSHSSLESYGSGASNCIDVIDVSKPGNESIDFTTEYFMDFMSDANSFFQYCRNCVFSEESFIEDSSKEWDRTERLNMTNPDKDYSVVIFSDLPTVTGETFESIPNYMSNCLQFNLLRYYLFEAKK